MFFHELGEDFVLSLELLLQQGDPAVLGVTGAAATWLEGSRAILEKLLGRLGPVLSD